MRGKGEVIAIEDHPARTHQFAQLAVEPHQRCGGQPVQGSGISTASMPSPNCSPCRVRRSASPAEAALHVTQHLLPEQKKDVIEIQSDVARSPKAW